VEAISVASVKTIVETRMEGHDANSLIASRMGIEPGEVTAKLVTLHQKNELNGAADGRADDDVDDVVVREVNVSLTLRDLEDFERFEKATAAEKLVPARLKMRPAVLGAMPIKPASASAPGASAAASAPGAGAPAREVVELASPSPPPMAPAPAPALAPAPAPAPATAPLVWCEDDDDEVEMEPEEDRAHGGRENETSRSRPLRPLRPLQWSPRRIGPTGGARTRPTLGQSVSGMSRLWRQRTYTWASL
jgi:hypothetical protein